MLCLWIHDLFSIHFNLLLSVDVWWAGKLLLKVSIYLNKRIINANGHQAD